MMTTMAALMGTLPIALGLGAGGESRRPLGLAVVGGLIVSQLLTLYITPVIYIYMDAFQRLLRRIFARNATRGAIAATPAERFDRATECNSPLRHSVADCQGAKGRPCAVPYAPLNAAQFFAGAKSAACSGASIHSGDVFLFGLFAGRDAGCGRLERVIHALKRIRQFFASGFELLLLRKIRVSLRRGRQPEDFARPLQRGIDVGTDILAAQTVDEPGLLHDHHRIRMGSAENKMAAFAMELSVQILEGIQAGGIHRHDFAHAQDEHFRLAALAYERGFELVHRAKKEGAHHAIDHHAWRYLLSHEGMMRAFGFGAFIDRHDLGRFRGAFDEQDGGEHHADFHRDGEVHGDREREGREENRGSRKRAICGGG